MVRQSNSNTETDEQEQTGEEHTPHLAQDTLGVGSCTVQLVDKGKTGNIVPSYLPVHREGL